MDDLISRRAAIDALCKACMLTSDYKKCEGYKPDSRWCEEITALREVPPAQPGVDLFPAVSEEYKKGYCDGLRDKPEPCDDTISRQAVIELIQGSICDLEYSDENKELCDKVRALPPSHAIEPEYKEIDFVQQHKKISVNLQLERKKGMWLLSDGYRCSCCNYKLKTTGIPQSCPNCDAEMQQGVGDAQ